MGWFDFFDFRRTEEREIYLLCANPESATRPVLVKIKCAGEVSEKKYYRYTFYCTVIEIEGVKIEEKKQKAVSEEDHASLSPKRQQSVLRQALANAGIEGNPIRVSKNYIEHHLKLAHVRMEIERRKQRKEAAS